MASTTIETIAGWASELAFEQIPHRVVEKARWQQASVLAASLAGLNDPGVRKVIASARKNGGSGRARVIAGVC
jgi:2-methylcitrate dehydratase PrpD